MKKAVLVIITMLFLSTANIAYSQKSSVRFMAFTLAVENYCSFAFEQKINQKHAIGLQVRANLYYFPFAYFPPYYINHGININYKFYLKNNELASYFLLAEIGYLHLHTHNNRTQDELKSQNATIGNLFGIRKRFSKSKRWFMEGSVGVIGMYRNYYYYDYINDDGLPNPHPIPGNEFLVIPRLNIEVGFYL